MKGEKIRDKRKEVSVKSWEKLSQMRSPSPGDLGHLNIFRDEKWVFTGVALVSVTEPYNSIQIHIFYLSKVH